MRVLSFLRAYADVYDMQHMPITKVCDTLCEIFNVKDFNEVIAQKDCIDKFLNLYNRMKEAGLDDEIKLSIKEEGWDFFDACEDWDV